MEPTQGSPQKGQTESNTVVPVTVHMLEKAATSSAPGGDLRVDGKMVNMLVVVGVVEDLNRQETSMEFILNDSTGKMKTRFFFSSDVKLDAIQNGTYVNAVGLLKMQPSVHFSLVALHPVQSPDQISYHMIEVGHASLRSKGKLMTAKAAEFASSQKTVGETPRPLVRVASQPMEPAAAKAPAAVESGPLRERIANFLSSQANPEGVAITDLAAHFNTVGPEAVKAAVHELLDDGSAYTTIDDDHFAAV